MTTATKTKDEQTITNRCDHGKVKIGSVFSRHSHGEVLIIDRMANNGRGLAKLRNSAGKVWEIGIDILEWEFSFADQFETEETLSRTKVIEKLKEHPGTAMTIVFAKKVVAKDVAKALEEGKGSSTQKDWTAKIKGLLEGPERTMVGHHSLAFDEHQRLRFVEQKNAKSGLPEARLVDLRTLKSLVVDRVRYTVKN